MRIARYSVGAEVGYGVIEQGDRGEELAVISGHPVAEAVSFTGERLALSAVRLLAPVLPTKVVAIGKNYAAHAAEMGGEAPTTPVIFLKPSTAVVGPDDPVGYPAASSRLDYEGELAVVIARLCRRVPAEEALDYVLGYTCANDITARDLQASDGQWTRAKGFDGFCPLGPWIETELDPSDVGVTTRVNGEIRQNGRTKDLIHPVPKVISFISDVMTLLPGDVILTGTPEGVGPMQVGDEVTVEIGGVGMLSNRVVAGG